MRLWGLLRTLFDLEQQQLKMIKARLGSGQRSVVRGTKEGGRWASGMRIARLGCSKERAFHVLVSAT